MSQVQIDMQQVATSVRSVLQPIALSHAHPDKRYSFEIRYDGLLDMLFIYAYDGVDENGVYQD